MDQKILSDAVENISIIKGVIDRTSKSFIGFSKIFIYWGLLFILYNTVTLIINLNYERLNEMFFQFPIFNFLLRIGIVAIPAILIYRTVSKRIPLVGFENHLMKLWVLTLLMNVIPPRITINTASGIDMGNISVESNNFSIMIFSLSIALIVTSLFTGYRQLRNMGFVYILVSMLYAFFNFSFFQQGTIIQLLTLFSIPFTFIYTGIFLKSRHTGGNSFGC